MARGLLHQRLLVRAVELLGELHRLQGCQAASHAVDDGDTLSLRGVQTCEQGESGAGVSAPAGAGSATPCARAGHGGDLGGHLLWAMAMTPESGVMMRFWDCCGLWWDRLWMLVRVLTGGSPPPDTEICQAGQHRQSTATGSPRPPPPPPLHSGGIGTAPPQRGAGWGLRPDSPRRAAAPPLRAHTSRTAWGRTLLAPAAAPLERGTGTRHIPSLGCFVPRVQAPAHGDSWGLSALINF